jgi:hypothetical protein
LKKWVESWEKAKQKEKKISEEVLREMVNISLDIANELFNIGDAVLANRLESINAEIRAEEEKYDKLMELAEGDEERQREISQAKEIRMKQLEAEELKLRQKSAKLAKAQALFDIAANTAVAIVGIWRGWGPLGPLGVAPATALTALVSALGAAQAAAVAAAPIPKYASGRIGGKEGLAYVGDGGQPEVVRKEDGSIYMTPNKKTLTWLDQGDSVYSSVGAYENAIKRELLFSYGKNDKGIESAIERGFKKALIKQTFNPRITVQVNNTDWKIRNSQF